jgi:hypothetical protein
VITSRANNLNNVFVFDPSTISWSRPAITGTFTPRYDFCSAAINNKIYAIGGTAWYFNYKKNEVLEVSLPSTLSTPAFDTTFLCTEKTVNITVNNPNDFPVTVTDVSLSGANASDFHVDTPFPLVPSNGRADIPIRFTPSVKGLAAASAIVSLDIQTGFTDTIPLSAYGEQLESKLFAPDNVHLIPGEEVLFPIYAKSPMEQFKSQSFVLSLSYDPSHLEAYDFVQDNTLTSGGEYTLNTDSAGYTVLTYQTLDGSIVSGGNANTDTPLVYIKFRSHLNAEDNALSFHKDYLITYGLTFPNTDTSNACITSVMTPGRISLDSTCERVSILHDTLLFPSESYIEPIRPNPVYNGHASFIFDVPQEDIVKLDVIDMLGNNVSTVLEETRKRGTYKVDWDTSKLPSGMYYIRLQTSGQIKTQQMVVVK